MEYNFKYKLLGILFYFIFSLAGLSILFIFPPRKLLFTESENDKIKQNLFKDFVKITYENINKPLIKNMTLTPENVSCEEGFEELIIKNQYYGNFSKFYGNCSFCIQRFNDGNYNYEELLMKLKTKDECSPPNKICGKLNLYHEKNKYLCLDKYSECPLNEFDFELGKGVKYKYPISNTLSYFIPYYGEDESRIVIVDMEIINNSRFCLERHNREKKITCEFSDNNECYIHVGFTEVQQQVLHEDYKFYPKNLAKWNLKNNDNIEHEFCNNNMYFYFLVIGYFNFTYDNLKDFKDEFPSNSEKNNSLYNTYEAYKSKNNFDMFFYLISCILLCWSLAHFIFQILDYCEVNKIRIYYVVNGIILLFAKIISFLGMIIYHFWFYLKIGKVYITLVDEPLRKLLGEYNSTRKIFITKIIFFWIIGFLVLCIDIIILFFSIFLKNLNNKKINPIEEDISISDGEKIDDNSVDIEKKSINFQSSQNIAETFPNKPQIKESNSDLNANKNENPYSKEKQNQNQNQNQENPYSKLEEINLEFVCKSHLGNIYPIKAKKSESFNLVIKRLKNTYAELKEKNMKVFSYDSKIINKDKTIDQNGLNNNMKIVIV